MVEPSAGNRARKLNSVILKLFFFSVLDKLDLVLQLVLPDVEIYVVGAVLVNLDVADDGLAADAQVTVLVLLETFLVEVDQNVHRSEVLDLLLQVTGAFRGNPVVLCSQVRQLDVAWHDDNVKVAPFGAALRSLELHS